jgi:uridine kinase
VLRPQIPIYDFKQSKRVGFTATPVPASRVVIIEGIYALNERLKHLLDLRVSIAGAVWGTVFLCSGWCKAAV